MSHIIELMEQVDFTDEEITHYCLHHLKHKRNLMRDLADEEEFPLHQIIWLMAAEIKIWGGRKDVLKRLHGRVCKLRQQKEWQAIERIIGDGQE